VETVDRDDGDGFRGAAQLCIVGGLQ